MKQKLIELLNRRREAILYLFFGGLTTLVNIVVLMALNISGMPVETANAIALAVSILFAYATNRRWVFESRTRGAAAWREFALFLFCRLATALLDEAIVVIGVNMLGPMWIAAEHMRLWTLAVKLVAQVLVVLSNYVLSKLIIFKKGE